MEVIHSATEIPAELNPIVNLFENTRCADCNAPEPDWTSLGFGTFVCLNCAGHHRAFGTHITYVRSVKLDTWSPSQTRCLEMGGNKAFADYASTFKHFSSYNKRIEKYTIPELLYYRYVYVLLLI